MAEHIYKHRFTRVQRRKPIDQDPDDNCVRLYRSSPEDVTLQIRTTKAFATVTLSFAEARRIAADLLDETGVEEMRWVRP